VLASIGYLTRIVITDGTPAPSGVRGSCESLTKPSPAKVNIKVTWMHVDEADGEVDP
jgi:hypothetical protein